MKKPTTNKELKRKARLQDSTQSRTEKKKTTNDRCKKTQEERKDFG